MNKTINENEGNPIGDNEIDSPSEGGQYLIEPDIGENDKDVFAVYFKVYSEEDWEYQCTFDTRKEAEDWIDSEIEYADINNKENEKYDEKSSNEWVSIDSLINEEDEFDDEFEPNYHIGDVVIWDDPDGEPSGGWTVLDIMQTGDGIIYWIGNNGSEAEVPENEICLDDNYKVDEQFNEGFFGTIANGIKGALKLVGKGLLVFIAGLGGSFLFGFPGLLIALALAFGIVSGEVNESGKMIVNEGMFGKVKDKIKAVLKILKNCSKEELKELNDRAKKNPQSVADDIKDLSEGKKDIDDLVCDDSLDESDDSEKPCCAICSHLNDELECRCPSSKYYKKEIQDIRSTKCSEYELDEMRLDESNPEKENDDELKNASPKKFKNDKGSTSELVTGSKKQVSEMTIQQSIDDAEHLCEMLWGQGKSNLRELLDSKIASPSGIMSIVEDMMGDEPPTLTSLNDLFAYDFVSILECLGADVEQYRDTLDIVKKTEDDSVEL